jgi:hypothetical protein
MTDEELLELFKNEVCLHSKEVDPPDEEDWYSLSLGFFIGKGTGIEKAHDLSRLVRYTYHYWQ